jgi:hypothetical protein
MLFTLHDASKPDANLPSGKLACHHLSFDLWMSQNSLALLGVVAHWMSKLQTTLLGLRRLKGAHIGENMSVVVLDVIRTFRVENRIGYYVLDNAESNDTCIKHLSDHIELPVLSGQPFGRRLRCFGYIVNLSSEPSSSGKT